jgi:thiol-disulfide isomerase/thioredoxin
MTTAAPLRSADLAGKVVLIELWATWCAPCVAAMDDLHALHAEFGGDPGPGRPRFEVLSISMDDDVAEVETFRKRWPMPWMHAFAGDRREQLYATFETGTLPFAVLVDERGDILAASTTLAPEDLRALLTEHLRTR